MPYEGEIDGDGRVYVAQVYLGSMIIGMEFLTSLDTNLYILIDHLPHPQLLNTFMLLISKSVIVAWAIFFLYVFGLIFIHKKNAGRGLIFLIVATLSGFVINSYGLKDVFHRARPFLTVPSAIVLQKETDYSFPSGHAFSAALLATLFIRKRKVFLFLSAYVLLVGFSRIYLGVHYPLDVLGGYAFGFIYGLAVNHFYERFLEEEEFHILKHHVEITQN